MAPGSSFGTMYKITTYGESHGNMLGVVIDGCPPGLELSMEKIQHEMNRRKPGQSNMTTQRKESDTSKISSGYIPQKDKIITTGHPIHMAVVNEGAKSGKYVPIQINFRQSHADYTFFVKYGLRDWRGGGRSSARETVGRVMAGAVAKQVLEAYTNIKVYGSTVNIGGVEALNRDYEFAESNSLRCPDSNVLENMIDKVRFAKENNDSVGGAIEIVAKNVPAGLGDPVFDKLDAVIAHALKSIPAVKVVSFGLGQKVESMLGSAYRDVKKWENGKMVYDSNNAGGIEGGISTGEDITMRLSIKPTPTATGRDLLMPNEKGENETKTISGDHDPTIMPRAVPVAESMVYIVLLDAFLKQSAYEHLKSL